MQGKWSQARAKRGRVADREEVDWTAVEDSQKGKGVGWTGSLRTTGARQKVTANHRPQTKTALGKCVITLVCNVCCCGLSFSFFFWNANTHTKVVNTQ